MTAVHILDVSNRFWCISTAHFMCVCTNNDWCSLAWRSLLLLVVILFLWLSVWNYDGLCGHLWSQLSWRQAMSPLNLPNDTYGDISLTVAIFRPTISDCGKLNRLMKTFNFIYGQHKLIWSVVILFFFFHFFIWHKLHFATTDFCLGVRYQIRSIKSDHFHNKTEWTGKSPHSTS